jgi:hypothetical protein
MYHETQCGCGQHGQGEEPGMGYRHRGWWGHHGYPGGGGMHHGHGEFMQRHFISKDEVIAKLEEYLKQLQAEAQGVEERIAELKKKS